MAGEGIGASGIVGIAFEATAGVYTAPTKYCPIRTENLKFDQTFHKRRDIRGVADVVGLVKSDGSVMGDIEMYVLPDCLPYFLHASRGVVVKTGTTPKTYTWTPGHGALPTTARTLSITVVRAGIVFGYTGCIVGASQYSLDGNVLIVRHTIVGRNESDQSVPTPTWPTSVPFGAGMFTVEIPVSSVVCDTDQFSLNIDDHATPEFRLCGDTGAEFVRFGERDVEANVQRDFTSKTDYTSFRNLTSQALKFKVSNGANADVQFDIPAAVKDSYEVGLSGQGDLVRATVNYVGVYDPTVTAGAKITVITTEDIT